MGGKTSAASKNKYIAKAYDRINFVMPKGRKAEIQEHAKKDGISSSEWINSAIVEKMNGGHSLGIKDLAAYARSSGMTEEEYIKSAVMEKMKRQDEEYQEEITRESYNE